MVTSLESNIEDKESNMSPKTFQLRNPQIVAFGAARNIQVSTLAAAIAGMTVNRSSGKWKQGAKTIPVHSLYGKTIDVDGTSVTVVGALGTGGNIGTVQAYDTAELAVLTKDLAITDGAQPDSMT